MKHRFRLTRHCLVVVASVLTVLPLPLVAQEAAPPPVVDIQLQAGGTLAGRVVDAGGVPQANTRLTIHAAGGHAREVVTDEQGRFIAAGLKGGLHQISTQHEFVVCRLWTPHSAPPIAAQELLLVTGHDIARGQRPIGDLIKNPLVIGTVIAAAIAIPIAVHNSGSDGS